MLHPFPCISILRTSKELPPLQPRTVLSHSLSIFLNIYGIEWNVTLKQFLLLAHEAFWVLFKKNNIIYEFLLLFYINFLIFFSQTNTHGRFYSNLWSTPKQPPRGAPAGLQKSKHPCCHFHEEQATQAPSVLA